MILRATFLFAALHLNTLASAAERHWDSYSTFRSRPDLKVPSLNITLHDERVSPGYVFISPHFGFNRSPDSGPYIFDNSGSLLWSGLDDAACAGTSDIQGLHVCKYQGQDHLCYWQGLQRGMHGSGLGVIMNNHYQIVKTVRSGTAMASVDLHEFRLTSAGTALISIYHPRFHGGKWILDSVFQEVDLARNEVIFEWSALDHVDPADSYTPSGRYRILGEGSSPETSWDFFHINSIDKNNQGDYLISARHMDAIFKISRFDGSILWQLNGNHSSFQLSEFNFQRQHHARFQHDSSDRTILSIFNNLNDGFTQNDQESTGLVVEINHHTKVATKFMEYKAPVEGGLISDAMGSMITLPDKNKFLSWGINSAMAEYLTDGTPIWYANVGWESANYRAYKSSWVGEPIQPPALWAYAKSLDSPTVFYVSWNGATEIKTWQFYTSTSKDGLYEKVGIKRKDGFETIYQNNNFGPWAFVEAIDVNGVSLRNSSQVHTYVPETYLMESCGTMDCFPSLTNINNGHMNEDWTTWVSDDKDPVSCIAPAIARFSFWRSIEIALALFGVGVCLVTVVRFVTAFISPPLYMKLGGSDMSEA